MEDFLHRHPREPLDFRECKYILAPMVDFSELPFRLLCRKYGAQLCYTPMIHAGQFVQSATLRAQEMQTCLADKRLMVQFCANDAATFATAAQYVAPYCDAVDLNLGCPQQIARRGHYGAFLTEWNIIDDLLRTARRNVNVPITCKIRLLETTERTIEYAQMLVHTGVSAIGLHGRRRDQIRDHSGAADWEAIRTVISAVGNQVPMIANGSIRTRSDIDRCVEQTGACGVMVAESALHNPALFAGGEPRAPYEIASDYLDIVAATWDVRRNEGEDEGESGANDEFTTCGIQVCGEEVKVKRKWHWAVNSVRGHLFKILHLVCAVDANIRDQIARARTFSDFRSAVQSARERCERDAAAYAHGTLEEALADPHFVPYWTSRSYFLPDEPVPAYVRRTQNKHRKAESRVQDSQLVANDADAPCVNQLAMIQLDETDDLPLLHIADYVPTASVLEVKPEKLRRRKQRALNNATRSRRTFNDCVDCANPRSEFCSNQRCRKCCVRFVFAVRDVTLENDYHHQSTEETAQNCEVHRCFAKENQCAEGD